MINHMKNKYLIIIGLLAANVNAAPLQVESCEQIRERIRIQAGTLPKVDTGLLQRLAARQDCRFSAAEVYRAAYGDKPLPRNEYRGHRHDHGDGD